MYVTIRKMQQIVKERDEILSNTDLTEEEQAEQVNFKFTHTLESTLLLFFCR